MSSKDAGSSSTSAAASPPSSPARWSLCCAAGAETRVAMTQSATRFITLSPFRASPGTRWSPTSSGRRAAGIRAGTLARRRRSRFRPRHGAPQPLRVGGAPAAAGASANLIARLALGLADDAVTATAGLRRRSWSRRRWRRRCGSIRRRWSTWRCSGHAAPCWWDRSPGGSPAGARRWGGWPSRPRSSGGGGAADWPQRAPSGLPGVRRRRP